MQQYQQEIKDNIQKLIQIGKINEANELISDFEKIIQGDLEIVSMRAIIAILQNQMSMAEEILLHGLVVDQYNFDLLYNLAYVYELLGRYYQAIHSYKRARRSVLYDIQKRDQIDSAIATIYQENLDNIKNEEEENPLLKHLGSLRTILFLDFDLSMETNGIAKILSEYGINIDLAYVGKNPRSLFQYEDLPYRKIIGFSDIDSLVEYAAFYQYDIIHVFPSARSWEEKIGTIETGSKVIFGFDCKGLIIEEILNRYSLSINSLNWKKDDSLIAKYQSPPVTIVIPTYNRPKYLNRLLSFLNTYQWIIPNIMVLDSSPIESKKLNKEICQLFNKLKIQYLEFDRSTHFVAKLYTSLEQIDTEFVCICADDDFIAEEGLIKSLEILIPNTDLFSVKGKNLYYINTMAKLEEYDFFNGLYDSEPLKRLEKVVQGFVPSLTYQVFRTEGYRKLCGFISKNMGKLPLNDTFQEYLAYFMVLLTGKVGRVNIDFNIRDKGAARETVVKNFPQALIEGTFNMEYRLFRDFLIDYGKTLHLPPQNLLSKIDGIFSDFLINFLAVPTENVSCINGEFDLKRLEIGMRKSWVWPC